MRILLCDDSLTILKILSKQLHEILSCDIIEARNGKAAVDAYIAHRPDYVVMDILMPVKDGLTALQEIIAHDADAKVIMLSSLGTKDNLQQSLIYGAIDFIQKPVDIKRLKEIFVSEKED